MVYIILFIFGFSVMCFALYLEIEDKGASAIFGTIGGCFIGSALTACALKECSSVSTDNHKSKTTCETTHRASISVDSVAVFKKEIDLDKLQKITLILF